MTNKLQNKIDELIKLEELHNIKEQYKQHKKTKGLYEMFDFKPLPQEIMDNANNDWEGEKMKYKWEIIFGITFVVFTVTISMLILHNYAIGNGAI